MTEKLEVIQADVDAAKAYWASSVAGWQEQTAQQEALVRAFARHRLSHSGEKEALIEALEPFAVLAEAFDAAARGYLGVGADGLLGETTLPVGGEAVRDRCTITIAALLKARSTLSTMRNNGNE